MKIVLDERHMIKLGGLEQKIHIRSQDTSLPVLLFLHGGPGVCNRHSILLDHADLMDTFTLVAWDQRGSGGSYFHVPAETLTVDRLVEDARELVEYLCTRFQKDKIFVIGGSWGSELGTYLSSRYPEHLAAFVGFGQVVNGAENETLSWKFCMEEAEKAGDEKALAILRRVGPPEMGCYKGGFDGMMAQRKVMMKYGGYSRNEKKRSYFSSMVIPVLRSGEYSVKDLVGLILGYKRVLRIMWPEVGKTNFERDCVKFEIPIYIFDGRLDKNTPSELVQHWFDQIDAPEKCLVWFENSGHNPMGDEGEKFKRLLREKLEAVKERETCRV